MRKGLNLGSGTNPSKSTEDIEYINIDIAQLEKIVALSKVISAQNDQNNNDSGVQVVKEPQTKVVESNNLEQAIVG